jgi:hypothetical protein
MKQLCLLFFVSMFVFVINAQVVNIENKRIYDDTSGITGSTDATFSFIQNKDLLYNFKVNSRIQYKTKKHYFFLLGDFFYSGGSKVYANAGMGHFRYAYRIKKGPWKWECYLQSQYNQLLNQEMRSLAGTGLRWKMLGKEKVKMFIGSSIFYEYEEIQPNNEFNSGFRWSSYFSWFLNFKRFSFSGTSYYQPLLQDFKDYRFAGQYAFLSKITERLRLKMELNLFFDSKPPENVRSTVSSFLIGFAYEFGK